jgi:hypothetical protein
MILEQDEYPVKTLVIEVRPVIGDNYPVFDGGWHLTFLIKWRDIQCQRPWRNQ